MVEVAGTVMGGALGVTEAERGPPLGLRQAAGQGGRAPRRSSSIRAAPPTPWTGGRGRALGEGVEVVVRAAGHARRG